MSTGPSANLKYYHMAIENCNNTAQRKQSCQDGPFGQSWPPRQSGLQSRLQAYATLENPPGCQRPGGAGEAHGTDRLRARLGRGPGGRGTDLRAQAVRLRRGVPGERLWGRPRTPAAPRRAGPDREGNTLVVARIG